MSVPRIPGVTVGVWARVGGLHNLHNVVCPVDPIMAERIRVEREACAAIADAHALNGPEGHVCEEGGCGELIASEIRRRT